MVFGTDLPTTDSTYTPRRDSTISARWNMSSNQQQLNAASVPIVHQVPTIVTEHDVADDAFVIECDDIGIVTAESPVPSYDDGISMNFSLGSLEDGRDGGGVFMTESSGTLPIRDNKSLDNRSSSISRGSFSNSLVGSSIGGGGNDKDNSRAGTPIIIHPCMSGGNSRASLISLGIKKPISKDETWLTVLSQIGLPFLIAGLGMVGAGLLLDHVMEWPVFQEIGELVILVTPLLGLKGNLEMTLAARLSTHSNIGNMDIPGQKWRICSGNLILDQLQAIVCGFVASVIAIIIGFVFTGDFHGDHMSLVVASSVLTASMVSLILGSTMITVILLSKRFRINPDNVATPVAGSLGDVVTLGMLSCFASIIFNTMKNEIFWIPFLIIAIYLALLPVCLWVAYRNEYTKPVVISGWVPLLVSVAISTGGGILLDLANTRFKGIALYQPVINGIGGNLVSVQASRISSYLHGECEYKVLPDKGRICESPCSVFFSNGINSMSARLLLFLAIPGHLLFSTVTHFVAAGDDTNYGPLFLAVYVSAAVIQVTMLLYIAKILTNLCWKRGVDPDTATIPYLTALGDFFGSGLLFVAFEFLAVFSVVTVST